MTTVTLFGQTQFPDQFQGALTELSNQWEQLQNAAPTVYQQAPALLIGGGVLLGLVYLVTFVRGLSRRIKLSAAKQEIERLNQRGNKFEEQASELDKDLKKQLFHCVELDQQLAHAKGALEALEGKAAADLAATTERLQNEFNSRVGAIREETQKECSRQISVAKDQATRAIALARSEAKAEIEAAQAEAQRRVAQVEQENVALRQSLVQAAQLQNRAEEARNGAPIPTGKSPEEELAKLDEMAEQVKPTPSHGLDQGEVSNGSAKSVQGFLDAVVDLQVQVESELVQASFHQLASVRESLQSVQSSGVIGTDQIVSWAKDLEDIETFLRQRDWNNTTALIAMLEDEVFKCAPVVQQA